MIKVVDDVRIRCETPLEKRLSFTSIGVFFIMYLSEVSRLKPNPGIPSARTLI